MESQRSYIYAACKERVDRLLYYQNSRNERKSNFQLDYWSHLNRGAILEAELTGHPLTYQYNWQMTDDELEGFLIWLYEQYRDSTIYYIADNERHLICLPYSIENLHRMASELNIKRCWFHGGRHSHYDIPKKREYEILHRCYKMNSREIYRIIHNQS